MLNGPHAAPDFFTETDIAQLFATAWEVHHNSSRTGVRLIGPKPRWARPDGGEAGLHPSNIHDNAYAVGTIDFTGDMPIILGPDGPSLGGFVCPATIVEADLWKIGQLKAGDTRALRPRVARRGAPAAADAGARRSRRCAPTAPTRWRRRRFRRRRSSRPAPRPPGRPAVVIRQDGDAQPAGRIRPAGAGPGAAFPRARADAGVSARAACPASSTSRPASARCRSTTTIAGCRARSCSRRSSELEGDAARHRRHRGRLAHRAPAAVVGRSGDAPRDPEVHAVGAPRCALVPEQHRVHPPHQRPRHASRTSRRIVFDASYLVLGLGDVYLGAPVATPLDPRHRLVTTKYNPARTWTPENAVGIGGAYLCVYGMEGPGGYQFVGPHLPDVEPLSRDRRRSRAARPGCCASSTRSASIPSARRSCSRSGRRSRAAASA